MAYPLVEKYGVSSPYGPRPGLIYGTHLGTDMPTPIGVDVPEWRGGVVGFEGYLTFTVDGRRYTSITLIVNHDDDTFTVYDHLSATLVSKGQRVAKGQVVARTGNSGYTTGPHLHLQWCRGHYTGGLINDYPTMDPEPELRAWSLTNQGGVPTGGNQAMTIDEYVADILDVIPDEPNYRDSKKSAFENHVAYVKTLPWDKRRAWVKGIMRDSGVLNATQMREHRVADEKALSQLHDENTRLRIDFNRQLDELTTKLDTADEVNQTLASELDELKTKHRTCVEQAKVDNDAIEELKRKLEEANKSARPIEAYGWVELIRMGVNKFLRG